MMIPYLLSFCKPGKFFCNNHTHKIFCKFKRFSANTIFRSFMLYMSDYVILHENLEGKSNKLNSLSVIYVKLCTINYIYIYFMFQFEDDLQESQEPQSGDKKKRLFSKECKIFFSFIHFLVRLISI